MGHDGSGRERTAADGPAAILGRPRRARHGPAVTRGWRRASALRRRA
ncbi:hypothetical protein GLE_5015 [Lysobacter enzymogenes]|uniref:Uncharacterized protein n=1 Tax=Lysobacter enzymogenes TaxID=69 RepID=A0A0S2DP66_LYSEN|nr:hypothetical protein GLE_5015 [Lysobacter enzymogenes]